MSFTDPNAFPLLEAVDSIKATYGKRINDIDAFRWGLVNLCIEKGRDIWASTIKYKEGIKENLDKRTRIIRALTSKKCNPERIRLYLDKRQIRSIGVKARRTNYAAEVYYTYDSWDILTCGDFFYTAVKKAIGGARIRGEYLPTDKDFEAVRGAIVEEITKDVQPAEEGMRQVAASCYPIYSFLLGNITSLKPTEAVRVMLNTLGIDERKINEKQLAEELAKIDLPKKSFCP